MNLKDKFTNALNTFLENEIKNPEVRGIFVTGSYVTDNLKPNSDIDVFIITTKNTMQIMAKYYDDIEFECCYKPFEQYIYDLEITKSDVDIQRFSNVEILYDPDLEVGKIVTLAKDIYNKGSERAITDGDLYHLNDAFLDLEDSLNDIIFKLNLYKCFESLVKIYFKKANLWQCKEKYYVEYISKANPELSEKVKLFLLENDSNKQYQLLLELKNYILSDVRSLDKNWKTPEMIAPVFSSKKP